MRISFVAPLLFFVAIAMCSSQCSPASQPGDAATDEDGDATDGADPGGDPGMPGDGADVDDAGGDNPVESRCAEMAQRLESASGVDVTWAVSGDRDDLANMPRSGVWAVATDRSNNVYVTGGFNGTIDFGCGEMSRTAETSFYATKLDQDGKCLWSRKATRAGIAVGTDLVVNASGDLFVMGFYYGGFDLGCGPLPEIDGSSVFYARLAASDGACVWSKAIPEHADFGPSRISYDIAAVQGADDIFLAGFLTAPRDIGCGLMTTGNPDWFVSRLDRDGECLWSKRLLGQFTNDGISLATTESQSLVLAFPTEAALPGDEVDFGCGPIPNISYNSDLNIGLLDGSGTCQWSKEVHGADLSWGPEEPVTGVDPSRNVYVAGVLTEPVDFGCGNLGTGPGWFLVKLDPSGNCIWDYWMAASSNDPGPTSISFDGAGNLYLGLCRFDAAGNPVSPLAPPFCFPQSVSVTDGRGDMIWIAEDYCIIKIDL